MMALGRNVVLLGVGVAGVSFLSTKTNRGKVKDIWTNAKDKTMSLWKKKHSDLDPLIEKAGHPDPYDHEDNKMVDEGAMYSVNYYNNAKHG
ncbi:hypothetical protein [Peribacillus butanolivorans]|uniref:hypothetical protein n=1 Tax=Peribacillus butanolivorans TaxID=421767 RepID=UPI00167F8653|nr:hypothetical protein [Peribacillus butanolivorans]QNU04430.1 hypothetical protein GM240_11040 [Peribacillus butanolivorans]